MPFNLKYHFGLSSVAPPNEVPPKVTVGVLYAKSSNPLVSEHPNTKDAEYVALFQDAAALL